MIELRWREANDSDVGKVAVAGAKYLGSGAPCKQLHAFVLQYWDDGWVDVRAPGFDDYPIHCPECATERGVPIPAKCPHKKKRRRK